MQKYIFYYLRNKAKGTDGLLSVKLAKQEGGENMGVSLGTALATAIKEAK